VEPTAVAGELIPEPAGAEEVKSQVPETPPQQVRTRTKEESHVRESDGIITLLPVQKRSGMLSITVDIPTIDLHNALGKAGQALSKASDVIGKAASNIGDVLTLNEDEPLEDAIMDEDLVR
jgi:hypothetical protein